MKRKYISFPIENANSFKIKLLQWSKRFEVQLFLDSSNYQAWAEKPDKYATFECLAALGVLQKISSLPDTDSFQSLKKFHQQTNDWLFGHLTYDLKNEVEKLSSANFDAVLFPEMYFFQPKLLFILVGKTLQVAYFSELHSKSEIIDIVQIISTLECQYLPMSRQKVDIKARVSRQAYLESVKKLQQHILRGDAYEINYCVEFFAEKSQLKPLETYLQFNELSPSPFASYYRLHDKYLISTSPERFLKKQGQKLISQPIKGTARRGADFGENQKAKKQLKNDPKERAENVMIVDLVRNDLTRTAQANSVQVEELCEIYTYPQVLQMVSTVVSQLSDNKHFTEAIRLAFPMGSMTGAPKISAMQLVEEFEETKRGLYSGSVGYISPHGDFDFNVIIRSILYNSARDYLSYMVGGAITALSVPEKEYEECLLKAKAFYQLMEDGQ